MKKTLRFEGKIGLCGLILAGLAFFYYTRSSASDCHSEDSEDEKAEWWQLSPLWVEDQKPHINPHKFKYLNNVPNLCKTGNDNLEVDILVMVTSAVKHVDRREAIRQTWASKEELQMSKAKLLFLLGQGPDSQADINRESELYGDILQEDFQDTYHNLTLKTIMGLKWVSIFCRQTKFVLKTDDDIYVNLPLLHSVVTSKEKREEFSQKVHGCIKNSPINSPKPIPADPDLKIPQHISLMRPALPEFTAGAGYILPGSIAPDLYMASLSTKLIPVEDAYTTGFCAKKINRHPPVNDYRFSCGELVEKDCYMANHFTGHKVTPERMFVIYEKLSSQSCFNSSH